MSLHVDAYITKPMKVGFFLNLAKAFSLSSTHFGYMLKSNQNLKFNLSIDLETKVFPTKIIPKKVTHALPT